MLIQATKLWEEVFFGLCVHSKSVLKHTLFCLNVATDCFNMHIASLPPSLWAIIDEMACNPWISSSLRHDFFLNQCKADLFYVTFKFYCNSPAWKSSYYGDMYHYKPSPPQLKLYLIQYKWYLWLNGSAKGWQIYGLISDWEVFNKQFELLESEKTERAV